MMILKKIDKNIEVSRCNNLQNEDKVYIDDRNK